MHNIDRFVEIAAVVIDRLYSTFPRRISLRNNSFGENLDEETLLFYRDTVRFLADEGVVRFDAWSTGAALYFDGVTLTAKGFDILSSSPESPNEDTTLGDRIGDLIKLGSGEAVKLLIREFISRTVAG